MTWHLIIALLLVFVLVLAWRDVSIWVPVVQWFRKPQRIATLQANRFALLTGTVQSNGESLAGPVTGRTAVYYQVELRRFHPPKYDDEDLIVTTIFKRGACVSFRVVDGSGSIDVEIDTATFDCTRRRSVQPFLSLYADQRDAIYELAQQADIFLGTRDPGKIEVGPPPEADRLECIEDVLLHGDRVAVSGRLVGGKFHTESVRALGPDASAKPT